LGLPKEKRQVYLNIIKEKGGYKMKNKSIQCFRCEEKYNLVMTDNSTGNSWCEECWESICEEEKNEEEK